jgi:hypothetical protein
LLLEDADELERTDDEQRPDGEASPGKPRLEDGRLEHGEGHENRPHSGEEIAEALADRNSEVAIEGIEYDRRRLPCCWTRVGILVGSRGRRDEEGPAGEPEELHHCRQRADRCRHRDYLEVVACQHLAEEHDGARQR